MASLSFHDRQHLQKVLAQQSYIASVFNSFVASVSPLLRKWDDTGKSNVWIRNGMIEQAIERELIKLHAALLKNISSFQTDAWQRANIKNDELIDRYLKGLAISEVTKKGMFVKNIEALKQFQTRKDAGMDLSTNVWNITKQTKTQIEFYLESGLSVGRSANDIGRDVRQLLNKPDKRFHRIRDKKGNLVMSQPMKDYHPGTGQYRSAKMNALRLSSTETNMSYRKSDHDRWNNIDFVLGFEVQRSKNNKGACSICDPLVGVYPKEFLFTGWHPFCLCLATPVLMDQNDFAEYLLSGVMPANQIISSVPAAAVKWVENNPQFFKKAG